jgi:hypothetical protein
MRRAKVGSRGFGAPGAKPGRNSVSSLDLCTASHEKSDEKPSQEQESAAAGQDVFE